MRIARLLPLLGIALISNSANAQKVDYYKADLIRVSANYVAGAAITPNWLEDSVRFWYRATNKSDVGTIYLVDPRGPSRKILFDNPRMAAALSVAADTIIDPTRLPPFKVVDTARAIELAMFRKKPWRCEIATYKCTALDSAEFAAREALRTGPSWASRSPDKKWDVFAYRSNLYVRSAALSDSEAVGTRDSAKRARTEGKKDEKKPAAPANKDTLPLPKGSTQLTTDGERFFAYGTEVRELSDTAQSKPARVTIVWSPDSRKFTVSRTDIRNVRIYPIYSSTSDQPINHNYVYATASDSLIARFDVHIIDVVARTNVKIQDTPSPSINFNANPKWNATSDKVFLINSSRGYKRMKISAVDAATGTPKMIMRDSFPSWIETRGFFVSNGGTEILYISERDGWSHIYRYSPDGTLKNQVESGANATLSISRVDSAAKQLYFNTYGREPGNPYYGHHYRANFDGSGLTLLTPEEGHHGVTWVPKASYFIDTYSRADLPPITVLRDPNGKVIMELARGDLSLLTSVGWTPPEVFQVKARDGATDLWGLMYKPSDFDPKKVYPIISHIYPGPQRGSVVGEWGFSARNDVRGLTELGFIIVQLDHQGSPKRSKSFHDFYFRNMGDNGIPDHVAAIRQLAARNPWIDINRVGIYGHSGGGFASTDAMFRFPDFFKVAVSGAGNHHPNTYGNFWAEKYQGLYDKAKYDEAANYTHAKNLKGHLLLMHGDMDDNVHPANTLKVVDALIKANKNFDMLIFPDAGHGLPDYSIRKQWDYFVKYLLGAEPPDDYQMMAPIRGVGAGPEEAEEW
jgi:dipeptidyl aminopeptidase/acylaminoacyl peptidase